MDSVQHDMGSETNLTVEEMAKRLIALERHVDILKQNQTEVVEDAEPPMLDKELAPSGRFAMMGCIGMIGVAVLLALMMADLLTPKHRLNRYIYGNGGRHTNCVPALEQNQTWRDIWTFNDDHDENETDHKFSTSRHLLKWAVINGEFRTQSISAATLTLVGYFCITLAALIPTAIVSFQPERVPRDFLLAGTLSNVSQDVATARGRVFTTMLFTGSLLMMLAGYPEHLYISWFPMAEHKMHVLFHVFQKYQERIARTAWATLPNVGLMLTAALPSLTDGSGTKIILTVIHTVAAPCSLIFLAVMETFQLVYGENAFTYFLCGDEIASWVGPLKWPQRLRVILVGYLWIDMGLFFSMQLYLYSPDLLPRLGVKKNTSYTFALLSIYAEITALLIAYGLPSLQALRILLVYMCPDSVTLFEAAAHMESLPLPESFMSGQSSSVLELANVSHPSLRHTHHTKFAKHLRAGADGLPFF